MFDTALKKLYQVDNITIDVSFKARRQDGLGLLMEAKGIRALDHTGSVWVSRPIALLGKKWKDFNSEEKDKDLSVPKESPECLGDSNESINTDLVLCHICERTIPALLFEDHNSLCSNVHRAELDLSVIQESLDNIRNQLVKQNQFLNDELRYETIDKEVDPQGLQEQRIYIACLKSLASTAGSILEKLDFVREFNEREIDFAKRRLENSNGSEKGALEISIFWECPPVSYFFPARDIEFKAQVMQTVKGELEAIGQSLSVLASEFEGVLAGLVDRIQILRQSTQLYQQAFLQEENVKIEIGLKTGTFIREKSGILDDKQEILDLLVRDDSAPSLPKPPPLDPLYLAQSEGDSSSCAPSVVSPISEYSSLPDVPGDSTPLRPQIPLNQAKKRSFRHPRIVVNTERILEIEGINSPSINSVGLDQSDVGEPLSPALGTSIGSSTSFIRRAAPSIKDYEIVKPISRGAFGSVYLAKKKVTGDYFAIKVLKKADMIAKNQVTNVRAERMILTQLDSPYVVRLYYSFQSKNHLYLVMEYLNGGDCASLLKAVGVLDEKWAKQYIAEMVLGLEFLHSRGIVHRYIWMMKAH